MQGLLGAAVHHLDRRRQRHAHRSNRRRRRRRLELSDQNDISAGTTGSVTVTATLLDDFPHALLGADSILIGGIQVRALEADGDFGVGKVRVRVLDDLPVAFNDSAECSCRRPWQR